MRFSLKTVLLLIWLLLLTFAIHIYLKSGMSLGELRRRLQELINLAGPGSSVAYVVIYSFRSLIFFPVSLLTAAGGLLFGPRVGMLLTVIGENISANLSFLVGRYFGKDVLVFLGSKIKLIPRFECKLMENGFMSVLVMWLIYLPFDLVGYSSGMCGIRQKEFALATFLGTLPGLATFILLGSAIMDVKNIVSALAFFVFGLAISKYLKTRNKISVFQTA